MTSYLVYESIKDFETDSIKYKNITGGLSLRAALVLFRSSKRFSGILEENEGEFSEHPFYYFEEKFHTEHRKVKYPQHILAFKAEEVEHYFLDFKNSTVSLKSLDLHSYMDFMNELGMVVLMRREELENDENFLQVLPYVVVRVDTPKGSKFLLYQRPSKGQGESRLAGLYSLGFGGHVDLKDIQTHNSVIELHSTLGTAAAREILEELQVLRPNGLDCTEDFAIEFTARFILERSEAVHRVHIASIAVMAIEAPSFDYFIITCRQEEGSSNKAVGLYTAKELLTMLKGKTHPMEAWTEALVAEIQNPKSLLNPYSGHQQLVMTLDGHDLGDEVPENEQE